MPWKKFDAEAIAIYPYSSKEASHLHILAGDRIKIIEQNQNWYRGYCYSTTCCGIFPASYVKLIESKENPPFNLLKLEAQILLNHLFSKVLIPTEHSTQANDKRILDLVRDIEQLFSEPKISSLEISGKIDEIRNILGFPLPKRDPSGFIIRTHDISLQDFTPSKVTQNDDDLFQPTVSLSFTISPSFSVPKPTKFVPRLYNLSTHTTISSPADVYITPENTEPITFTFANVPKSSLETIAFVLRIYTSVFFGNEKVRGPHASEYIGVSVQQLSSLSSNSEFIPNFFISSEIPMTQVLEEIIKSQSNSPQIKVNDSILKSEYPEFQIKYTIEETPGESTFKENYIQPLLSPANIGTDYIQNNFFIHINTLHHKSSLKRTRVIIKMLDLSTKTFVKCFKGTYDPSEFTSVVQKGFFDMPIDEYVNIDLNVPFDLNQAYIIVEVTRPSRSKGTNHLSSISFKKLTGDKGQIDLKEKTLSLVLQKPPSEKISPETYSNIVLDDSKPSGLGGTLDISLFLNSNKNSSRSPNASLNSGLRS